MFDFLDYIVNMLDFLFVLVFFAAVLLIMLGGFWYFLNFMFTMMGF